MPLFKGVILAVIGATAGSLQAESNDPLAPLRFLSGACWRAPFPGETMADIQCVEPMEGGRFLRARHVVRGSTPEYSGETIYWVDGQSGTAGYIYFTSLGGISRGSVVPTADGVSFPNQRHIAADGRELWLHAELTRIGADRFRTTTRRWTGSGWSEPFVVEFQRLPERYRRWEDVAELGATD